MMDIQLIEPVITGVVASGGTLLALKTDLKNLREWVRRVDRVASKANEKATTALARIGADNGQG